LYRGGITEETLAVSITLSGNYFLPLFLPMLTFLITQILIKDDAPANENGESTIPSAADETSESGAFLTQQSASTIQGNNRQDYSFGRSANYTPRNTDHRPRDMNGFQNHSQTNDDFSFMPDGPDGFYDGGSGNNDSQTRFQRQQYDKFAKRTVQLINLPESTTHTDIVDVIKGGMLLDIYLRIHDRTASVSFLEEAHAQEFFRHVKRHDLYVRGKRVRTTILYRSQYDRKLINIG
jgi:hypothetical protein